MKLEKNWLEWAVFAFSLLLTLGVIGFLTLDSFASRTPARLEVTLGAVKKSGTEWRVPVRVDNRGDITAAAVAIEVTQSGSDETSELEFDFVPRQSQRDGFALFSTAPKDLEARVRSYQAP